MHFRSCGALGLLFVAACASDTAGPAISRVQGEGGGDATLTGIVQGFTAAPDSTLVPVAGAQVVLVRVGDISVDSSSPPPDDPPQPPPPPSDTTLWIRQAGFGALLDSVIPPPPPPPPPVVGCGRDGETVATVSSEALGAFTATGLKEGIYDVVVTPPEGSGFGGNFFCGLAVRSGSENRINLYVPSSN